MHMSVLGIQRATLSSVEKIPCACIHRFTTLIINLLGPLNHVMKIILHKL